MVSWSPSEKCDGIAVRVCKQKVVSKWAQTRKAEVGGKARGRRHSPEGQVQQGIVMPGAGESATWKGQQSGTLRFKKGRHLRSRQQRTDWVLESSQPREHPEPRCSQFMTSWLWSEPSSQSHPQEDMCFLVCC